MEGLIAAAPWLALAFVVIFALILLRRQLRVLFSLLARTGVGLFVLACTSALGGFVGVTLGVNLANALVIGILGAPGLGLLLMMNWLLSA